MASQSRGDCACPKYRRWGLKGGVGGSSLNSFPGEGAIHDWAATCVPSFRAPETFARTPAAPDWTKTQAGLGGALSRPPPPCVTLQCARRLSLAISEDPSLGSAKLRVYLANTVYLATHVDDPQLASPAAPSQLQLRLLPPYDFTDITHHPSLSPRRLSFFTYVPIPAALFLGPLLLPLLSLSPSFFPIL